MFLDIFYRTGREIFHRRSSAAISRRRGAAYRRQTVHQWYSSGEPSGIVDDLSQAACTFDDADCVAESSDAGETGRNQLTGFVNI